MPKGLVSCMQNSTLQGSQELMKHHATSLILATGGAPMVRAAHSTGKPALGVGPGNVPVYVDRSADVRAAAEAIVNNSKSFDCSVICATRTGRRRRRPDRRAAALGDGRPRRVLGAARRQARPGTAALHQLRRHEPGRGRAHPAGHRRRGGHQGPARGPDPRRRPRVGGPGRALVGEKLTTVLGFYVADGWRAGCERSLELLRYGGDGHSWSSTPATRDVILAFGLEKPAFRILVNTWGTLGAIGATTGVMPSLTLGPGGSAAPSSATTSR